MPRRRPGSFRRAGGLGTGRATPRIPGLSGPAHAAIVRLEGGRFAPGDVHDAFDLWRRYVTAPVRLWERDTDDDHGPSPREARDSLDRAVHWLPAGAARELRREVDRLDRMLGERARRAGVTHLVESLRHAG